MTDSRSQDRRKRHVLPLGGQSVWIHLILAGTSAILMALAYPRLGYWLFAIPALWPLGYLAVTSSRQWRLCWTVLLVQVAWWLIMIRWLIPVTLGGYIALAVLMAIYCTVAVLMVNICHQRWPALPAILTVPAAWVCMELVRGSFPEGGFGWFFLGHCMVPIGAGQSPGKIVQVADLFGTHAVSFLVVMSSGLMVDLTLSINRIRAGRVGSKRAKPGIALKWFIVEAAVWMVLLTGAWFYGLYRIGQYDRCAENGPAVCVVQTNVPQNNRIRPSPEQVIKDWGRLLDMTELAAQSKPVPDLIVWPETVAPLPLNPTVIREYLDDANPNMRLLSTYHEQIRHLAARFHVNILVGASAREDDRRYNAAYLYHDDGNQNPLRYDKVHLVPFGEYIPWINSVPALKDFFFKYISPYDFDYTLSPGDSFTVFEFYYKPEVDKKAKAMLRVASPICYEDVDAAVCRRMVYSSKGRKRVDMLVNLTNSAWYSGLDQRPQHLQIAAMRSIENRVPMARSVNTGISAILDSLGTVRFEVRSNDQNQFLEGFISDRVMSDPRNTLYGRLGCLPMMALSLLFLLLVLMAILTRRQVTENHS